MNVDTLTKLVGRRVRLVTIHGTVIIGQLVATCDSPSVEVLQENGQRVTYATNMIHRVLDDTCPHCRGSGVIPPAMAPGAACHE